MKLSKLSTVLCGLFLLAGCIPNMNPTGNSSAPNYPYFIATEPLVVKNILVPRGSQLTYEKHLFKEGAQNKIMSEEKLQKISFPIGETISWGGVPITSITKFFNSEMRGFSVSADFSQLSSDKRTKFAELWNSCSSDLGIAVKNTNDWSFNTKNISDVQSCSVNYQRYFKEDTSQQKFLDELFAELMRVGSR